jgi:hypothetical protein
MNFSTATELQEGIDFMNVPEWYLGGAPRKNKTNPDNNKTNIKTNVNPESSVPQTTRETEQMIVNMSAPSSNTLDVLAKALFRKRKTMAELIIDQPLAGVVSLSILEQKGFTAVETIRFKPGTITEIKDVPHTVYRIIAPHNRIQTVDHFPEQIEYLDLENNQLSGPIDLSKYSALKHINLGRNEITEFVSSERNQSALPNTLVELMVPHNQIRRIQLSSTPILTTLDLSKNPDPIIIDMPDTIRDLRIPEGAVQQSHELANTLNSNSKSDSKSNSKSKEDDPDSNITPGDLQKYREAIDAYYLARSQYQTKLNENKKKKSGSALQPRIKLPPCTGCGRKVGMIFSSRNHKHMAMCGSSSSPCDWRITVERGEFYPVRNVLKESVDLVNQTRDNIIRQKMDTLFEYITDEKSAEIFGEHIGYYKVASETASKYNKAYETAFFNEARESVIAHKLQKIQHLVAEVKVNLEAGNAEEAARIQSEEIAPISRYIHSLRFEVNSHQSLGNNGIQLIQHPVSMARSEINIGLAVHG